jgi:hypothetical protein
MTAPAEGWYQDPADAGAWRWWDGTSWTDHIRPVEELPQSQPVPIQAVPVHAVPLDVPPVQDMPPHAAHLAVAPEANPPEPVIPAGVVIEPVPTHAPVFEEIPAPPQPAAAAPEPAPAPAPVDAQPAPQPAPVDAQTIPQPGEVAPAPVAAPAAGNVSLTPAIPVTDQMYWHSAAAEKIEVPRLTQAGTGAINVQRGPLPPSYVRDWNDLGSPNNGGIWLLALSPLLYIGVSFVLGLVNGLSGNVFGAFGAYLPLAVLSGLNWIFAYADQRSLRERGYHPPAIWWMLLLPPLPLGYLIARGRSVRREGMRAWPPELIFVMSLLTSIAINVIAVIGIAIMLGLI